jgi:hypothetical protein
MKRKLSIAFISIAVILITTFGAYAQFTKHKKTPIGECGVTGSRDSAFSPNKQDRAVVVDETDFSEVWIENLATKACALVIRTQSEYAAGRLLWSNDGGLLAFEVYNRNGHSPLTTNHVEISRKDGTGVEKIMLPSPNQQLSTYILRWADSDSLLVTALLPGQEAEIHYMFNYETQHGRFMEP